MRQSEIDEMLKKLFNECDIGVPVVSDEELIKQIKTRKVSIESDKC